jgi:hypothetical protein
MHVPRTLHGGHPNTATRTAAQESTHIVEWRISPDAAVGESNDAVVRFDAVTIFGTDRHIFSGDVPGVGRHIV